MKESVSDMLASWKTTLVGILGAAATAAVSAYQYGSISKEALIQAAIIGALGFLAKDGNKL